MMSVRMMASIFAYVLAWMVVVSSPNAPCWISPPGPSSSNSRSPVRRTRVTGKKFLTGSVAAIFCHVCSTELKLSRSIMLAVSDRMVGRLSVENPAACIGQAALNTSRRFPGVIAHRPL